MAAISVCRGILKEIRIAKGSDYKQTLIYKYVLEQFRRNQVTGAQLCRARMEALHAAQTYGCLLSSTRLHLRLHQRYHARGECRTDQAAGLVGLRLPTQPGGKGWET
ncbi:protein FMC1 homolog [Ctenopharyngodon idella]|uniref:protein FMC1 homolog n=1 Tax=Ctenopharyngodon idella TaxID=7959 RepID=UPI00223222A5|nr:protein FMC1 homolog [Ctenopharyngodon idella]